METFSSKVDAAASVSSVAGRAVTAGSPSRLSYFFLSLLFRFQDLFLLKHLISLSALSFFLFFYVFIEKIYSLLGRI